MPLWWKPATALRRESSFPSSSAFFLSAVMMTNRPPLPSNRSFRDDKSPSYFPSFCLLSQTPARQWLMDGGSDRPAPSGPPLLPGLESSQ